jgi:heavy metal sensor kinase
VTRLGLRARLSLWFAGAVFVIVTPYAVAVLGLQWRALTDALEHHLEEDYEVALQMLVVNQDGRVTWRSPEPFDPGYDAGPQRWVEVWAARGELLFRRGTERDQRLQDTLPPAVGSGLGFRSERAGRNTPVRVFTGQRLVSDLPLVVRVGRDEEHLREEFATLLAIFLFSIPLAVLAAAGAGYAVAGRALSPVARLAERARQISVDRLSDRLPVENPHDELGEMANVFNETFGRIELAFDRLRRFTADASHELRTPLTAIRSVGEVGLQEGREPEEYREVIGSMLEETDRLAQLVDELLTLSRFDSGKVALRPDTFDLRDLATEVVAHLAVLAEEKDVTVTVEAAQPVPLHLDRLVLRQAVINLLDNAIKYAPDHGHVRITVALRRDVARLAVRDDGPGIAAQHHARIFDRFYRVDEGRAREVGGTGLGLAIARWAVVANGGHIDLTSEPGRGACFTIVLPVSEAVAMRAPAAADA